MSGEEQRSWLRRFQSFVKQEDITSLDAEDQLTALETGMALSTFMKVNAMRLQLPSSEQEDIMQIIKMIEQMIEEKINLWIARHELYQVRQTQDESVKSFHTRIVEKSKDCNFAKDFCVSCKPKVNDLIVLMQLVFNCHSVEGQKELFKEKDLKLEKALELLQSNETLEKTREIVNNENTSSTLRIQDRYRGARARDTRSGQQNGIQPGKKFEKNKQCSHCGKFHAANECPAKGSTCRRCGGSDHWASVCTAK
jgi:hypothetical protein